MSEIIFFGTLVVRARHQGMRVEFSHPSWTGVTVTLYCMLHNRTERAVFRDIGSVELDHMRDPHDFAHFIFDDMYKTLTGNYPRTRA